MIIQNRINEIMTIIYDSNEVQNNFDLPGKS